MLPEFNKETKLLYFLDAGHGKLKHKVPVNCACMYTPKIV